MKKIEQIQKEIAVLLAEKKRAENAAFREKVVPLLRAMIGKTYAYRNNSYSCPEPHEHWDEFRRVLDVVINDKDGWSWIIFEQCSVDYKGNARLSSDAHFGAGTLTEEMLGPGWQECPAAEFENARTEALAQIANPSKLKAYYV